MYDLTAEVSYVNNLTSKSLILIPFSMGSPMSLIMGSERPEMQSKIRLIVHLAPGVYLSHIKEIYANIALPFRYLIKVTSFYSFTIHKIY